MAENYFQKVTNYILDLGYNITLENVEDEIIIISNPEEGIQDLIIGCADPILIMEQHIFDVKNPSTDLFRGLLKKNRDIVHGAFVLDDSESRVLYRDTLQLENLDQNEIEASIKSLSLLMSEYSDELIAFAQ